MHMPPPVHGAAMMGKYIHDSKLINESFDCHYINLTTAKNLEDIGHFRFGKIIEFAKLLHRIKKSIRKLHPDLVYVTPNAKGGAFYKDFIVVEMIKSMGCKVIVHYHNKGVATRQDHWLDDKLYRKFFNGIKVILLAEALYPDVQKYVRRGDVYICPNGIPDTTECKEPTAERHNKIPHLLFLSNLLVSKGVIVLLDALKILKDRGYSFVCDFVGGETDEIDAARFKEEVEQRGLNQLVIYNGKKFGEDKDVYYEKADVFVFPSTNEAFPLVNIEAMEHKIPIISTNVGGIPDEVIDGQNGLISEIKNPMSLADCIAELLNNKELREAMGEDGYKKFKAHFTLQAFENKFNATLGKAVLPPPPLLAATNLAIYWGKKFGSDKDAFFRNADIFVFPTYYPNECFPLVLLEAMQQGLPCISTKEGGITSIIDDGKSGLLVNRQDAEDLANKIAWMLEHTKERIGMGVEGYRKVKSKFIISQFEKNLATILEDNGKERKKH